MKIEKGQVHWFVHQRDSTPLGFIRMKDGGALVVGGKTGSHVTGHGESYWKKITEIIALGYVPVETAIELGSLPSSWAPPGISSPTDREWIEKIKRNEM
jgi:hypothetical protein